MPAAIISFSNPDSIEKTETQTKNWFHQIGRGVMFTNRKMIVSWSLWLLAVCLLPLGLAAPAAASSADLAAQVNHLPLLAQDPVDLPGTFIPKPPPPPPAREI